MLLPIKEISEQLLAISKKKLGNQSVTTKLDQQYGTRMGYDIVMIMPTQSVVNPTWKTFIGSVAEYTHTGRVIFEPATTEAKFDISLVYLLQPETIQRQADEN